MSLLENSFIVSLIVLFLHYTSWKGEIFEGIKKVIPPKGKLYKPIYGCPACMTFWWGSAIYWIFFHISFIDWALTIGTASGISVVLVLLLSIKDSLED